MTFDGAHAIAQGDVLAVLRELPSNEFDACLCDPPYGFSFMGKKWDYDVPSVDVWRELLRVLKPGAPVIAFGGTRTFHRVAVGIEDAGFELRDVLSWNYGSGFPKSLDVSKALDKAAGAEREKTPTTPMHTGSEVGAISKNRRCAVCLLPHASANPCKCPRDSGPASAAGQQWAGYGTALKPAWESAVMARKPMDISGLTLVLAQTLTEVVCQLSLLARDAGCLSASSLSALQPLGSARWGAVATCNTPGALLDLTATWPSASETPSCLNTALSWLRILADVSERASTFTTETASSLTIDLRTLSSSTSAITPESIIRASTGQRGITSIASLAESVFAAVKARLDLTRITSAGVPATSMAGVEGLLPNWEPAILARKPLEGTVAANVDRWGVGGLAIDACRIAGADSTKRKNTAEMGYHGGNTADSYETGSDLGRWPANVIMDEEAGAAIDAQTGPMKDGTAVNRNRSGVAPNQVYGKRNAPTVDAGYGGGGGPSRFFYSAKVSTKEREWGCDAFEIKHQGSAMVHENGMGETRIDGAPAKKARNTHPTLKPIALARWLARLIMPPTPNAKLLVPFSGAGSEMIGALEAGWPMVFGIEGEEAYIEIAHARIDAWKKGSP